MITMVIERPCDAAFHAIPKVLPSARADGGSAEATAGRRDV